MFFFSQAGSGSATPGSAALVYSHNQPVERSKKEGDGSGPNKWIQKSHDIGSHQRFCMLVKTVEIVIDRILNPGIFFFIFFFSLTLYFPLERTSFSKTYFKKRSVYKESFQMVHKTVANVLTIISNYSLGSF